MPNGPPPTLRRALLATAALACVVGLHDIARIYDGFPIPYVGVHSVHPDELAFYAWFLAFGVPATLCAALAMHDTVWLERWVLQPLREALARPKQLALAAAVLCIPASLIVRYAVLLDQPISDDELAYELIAHTLLGGHVSNPVPLSGELLVNQFTLVGPRGWYAKYPIGQGAFLALGEWLGAIDWVVPVVAALGALLTYEVGKRLLDARRAACASVLLVLSPQYVFTHATWLSQPASMLCMLGMMLGVLRLKESGHARWALLAGAALGLGAMVRPMPTTLLAGAAAAAYLFDAPRPRWSEPGARVKELALAAVGPAFALAVLLYVNAVQTGNPFVSGYQQMHGEMGIAKGGGPGALSASIAGAALRQSLWLLAWPIGLAFVALARMDRGRVLFWGMLLAEYAYRVTQPKTVVATTGPIYVLEAVPLLCLATVDGMSRAAPLLRKLGSPDGVRSVVAVAFAATLVGFATFLPVQIRNIRSSARERTQVFELIELIGAERPVVFANLLVFPGHRRTWAYFPPNPRPDLSDDVLFLRAPQRPGGYEAIESVWRTRFADRRAFILHVGEDGPALQELPVAPEHRKALVPPRLPL